MTRTVSAPPSFFIIVLLTLFVFLLSSFALVRAEDDTTSFRKRTFVSSSSCVFHDDGCSLGGWQRIGRAHPEELHSVTLAIRLHTDATASCDSILREIYTPGSPYGNKRYTHKEVGEMFSNLVHTRTVEAWLRDNDISFHTHPNGDFIKAEAEVAELERLFDAEFHKFAHDSGNVVHRARSISVPEHIAEAIDFVTNTIQLPHFTANAKMPYTRISRQAPGYVSPGFLFYYYGVPNITVSNPSITQGVYETDGQSFVPSDLVTFQKQFDVFENVVASIQGTNNASECTTNVQACTEASLDLEYIMAMAQNVSTTVWSVPTSTSMSDWISEVAVMSNPPLVISISYGIAESAELTLDMDRFNTEVCKLSLQGVTLIVASGDDGVAGEAACQGSVPGGPPYCTFSPTFPATCPYVTAVGATQGPEEGEPEITCSTATGSVITSGGGFSDVFQQPSYQSAAVSTYLSTASDLPSRSMFNSSGRAYPDVALMGNMYAVAVNGTFYLVSGTSASTPTFAGMISLINFYRAAYGMPPVGFINPSLYQFAKEKPAIFNDITKGNNDCCGTPSDQCCSSGFPAAKGWDATTGLGSVNFPLLLQAFLNSSTPILSPSPKPGGGGGYGGGGISSAATLGMWLSWY